MWSEKFVGVSMYEGWANTPSPKFPENQNKESYCVVLWCIPRRGRVVSVCPSFRAHKPRTSRDAAHRPPTSSTSARRTSSRSGETISAPLAPALPPPLRRGRSPALRPPSSSSSSRSVSSCNRGSRGDTRSPACARTKSTRSSRSKYRRTTAHLTPLCRHRWRRGSRARLRRRRW